MTRKTNGVFVLLLSVPLFLGAVAGRQQVVKEDIDVQVQPMSKVQPTTPGAPTQDVAESVSEASSSLASYAIDWYSINGGGAMNATSTNYQMGASIGQSVAGAASSASYQMGIGFWYGAGSGGGCLCPNLNDPDPNGVPDIVDVGLVINRAFRGAAALTDPGCPQERTDVDGSGSTDIVDVGLYINVAFRGFIETATFDDDGCTPGNQ